MKKLYLQLNEPGSGEITLPRGTQAAADAIVAPWIDLDHNGTILGGFLGERVERVPVIDAENAGRTVRVTGRGPLAILDQAIVWDWGTPNLEKERYFNSAVGGDNFITPMIHKGHILHRLLTEALLVQTNPSGDTMDRQCFHDSGGNHMISWIFDATQDSDAMPWDAAESEDLRARVGATFLELFRQYSALGQPTAPNVFEIEAVHLSTGVFDIRIHQTATGVSFANANCYFRAGSNLLTVSDVEERTGIRNAAMVAYTDPVYPYIFVSDPTSILGYWRCEEVLESSNAVTAAQAYKFGMAELEGIAYPGRVITFKVTDLKGPRYGVDYKLGDWVFYEDENYAKIPVHLMSLNLEWDDDVPLTVTAEAMTL